MTISVNVVNLVHYIGIGRSYIGVYEGLKGLDQSINFLTIQQ